MCNGLKQGQAVRGVIQLETRWWIRNYSLKFPNPLRCQPDVLVEHRLGMNRRLRERFGDLPLGAEASLEPECLLECNFMMILPQAYGAAEPWWSETDNCFWNDHDRAPFREIKTVDDVMRIPVPQWDNVPIIQEVISRKEAIERTLPGVKITCPYLQYDFTVSEKCFSFSSIANFIDMGPYLMGSEAFFESLILYPEMAEALLQKTLDIALDYKRYMRQRLLQDQPFNAISNMGGDYATMHSPEFYDRFAWGYDKLLLEHFGWDIPTNLHSCGPSAHIYECWRKYPNVVLMQTRWMQGRTRKLRQCLPNTFLQLTLAPQQFDFESADDERIKRTLWQIAEDAGFRDVEITALVSGLKDPQTVDRKIRLFYDTIDEINASR